MQLGDRKRLRLHWFRYEDFDVVIGALRQFEQQLDSGALLTIDNARSRVRIFRQEYRFLMFSYSFNSQTYTSFDRPSILNFAGECSLRSSLE